MQFVCVYGDTFSVVCVCARLVVSLVQFVCVSWLGGERCDRKRTHSGLFCVVVKVRPSIKTSTG